MHQVYSSVMEKVGNKVLNRYDFYNFRPDVNFNLL